MQEIDCIDDVRIDKTRTVRSQDHMMRARVTQEGLHDRNGKIKGGLFSGVMLERNATESKGERIPPHSSFSSS